MQLKIRLVMKYIDKSALVAEIKKRILEIEEIGTYLSPKGILTNLLCHINSLEVKEVDLEKEIDNYIDTMEVWEIQEAPLISIENTAKHFFELGLKSQKGE